MEAHTKVLITGGGSGGVSAASRLLRKDARLAGQITIIDPAEYHDYQPLWTLVGGGEARKEESRRTMKSVIPEGAEWIQERAASFDPDNNSVYLGDGSRITYDYLIVAAGIQINWSDIPGLKENLGKNGVCSNYSYEHTDYTWELIRSFKGGNAVFTHPATPVKCGGAPQKIMYLAEDYFQKSHVRNKTEVIFGSANPGIFDVQKYKDALEKIVERKKIKAHFRHNLVSIDGEKKTASFENLDTKETKTFHYDMLHVTPPMGPPAFIAQSPLSDENGWLDVHPHTLQHARYTNIFGLGDCCNLPTSKTGAAIRKQAPTAAENLLQVMNKKQPEAVYDGYSSCPLVTGYNKLILAEFDYNKNPQESMPFNQAVERRSMYMMKKDLLPVMYWNGMLKGTM
ncbi:MAG: NAD(P)/FAD-dependent oxidoreductase [Alkalicoccus sp.]|nr:MAG: NAD(P)/FAD-dependent oxidoreductase [Alkalicoccus sp.]